MKWFKHISDSLDDPFIFDMIKKHDANGYLVFFGILEIYAREFKTEPGWKLQVSMDFLRLKLQRSRRVLIEKVLTSLSEAGKWDVDINNGIVTIFIPKFRELLDESTLKKLREIEKSFRNHSGTIPKTEATDIDKEEEYTPTPLFPYPECVSRQLWEDFIEHRKVTIKKPLTVKAAQITIRKLEQWKREGHNPTAIVEDAIANGWRGVFAPNNYPQKKKNPDWQ